MTETRRIGDIVVSNRARKDMGDIEPLARSIDEHGLLHPIVINHDNTLIAGERRLRACQLLGWNDVPVRVIDVPSLVAAERAENELRKDFTPSERVAIAREIDEATKEQNASRRKEIARAAGKASQAKRRGEIDIRKTLIDVQASAARTAAAAVGMSTPTYYRARRVVEAAEREPAKFCDLVEAMDRTGKVFGAYAEFERRNRGEQPRALKEQKKKRHAFLQGMRYPKADKAVERAIQTLDGVVLALDRVDPNQLDSNRLAQWAVDLRKSINAIARFSRGLANVKTNEDRLEDEHGAGIGTERRPGSATQAVASMGA